MSVAALIEEATAELNKAKLELSALIAVNKTSLLGRALESIEDRIHEALVKLGG